jgi:hypothetical protein
MKRSLKFLLVGLLGIASVLSSCEKDDPKYPPVIKFNIESEKSIAIDEELVLKPTITESENAIYSWLVNGEEKGNESTFVFSASEIGMYSIKLIVINDDGEDKAELKIRVKGPYADGTIFVIEGNMSNQNGSLCFVNENGDYTSDIYFKENGTYIGNVLQDIYIHKGKIYMITQNGDKLGGDGRFVIANAETMKKERVIEGGSMLDSDIWPQHLVVINDDKAYVRYSTSDMEQNSGIRILDLKAGVLASEDIEGTYGKFTVEGSTKTRMVYTDGYVFAPCGHSLAVIDVETDKIVKRIELGSQVKGIVKGHDGNIWMTVAGEFTGSFYMPTYTSQSRVVGIDVNTYEIIKDYSLDEGFNFPVATWTPSIGMCASFNEDVLFFWNGPFSSTDVYRFDYTDGTITHIIDLKKEPRGLGTTIYGYLGVDRNDRLYVGCTNYMWTKIAVFNATTGERIDITDKEMDNDNTEGFDNYYFNGVGSPSGIDFTYRF